ncbi:MAG TPA: fumarylacetoacetate hydrolase family protein [Vicinamibacterales bacterium]|jgi:2-oxo-3-hexenedioate decarboxylase|nr:fumarylacetoacetate hydrolase family protein [Vicinamibacterales bacterium]
MDPKTLADEIAAAYRERRAIPTLSSRDSAFGLSDAYAVEAELVRMRRSAGRRTVGRKVGFANKAMWRALQLDTLVWAYMYDDTVRYAERGSAALSVAPMFSPKIEPEIVFKLKRSVDPAALEPAAVLDAVEWLALGFEIIDCVFPDWKFQPADFVASYGLHAALVVGEPLRVEPATIASLADALPRFTVQLRKNGDLVEQGSGKNSLRSPALCLGELGAAIARRSGAETLAAGELISSGTLTTSRPIAAGEQWSAIVDGLDLAPLALDVRA